MALSVIPASARADAIVAVAGPQTGTRAAITDAITAGARDAAERINASGGINGERIAVETVDDGCEAASAGKLAAQLSARKVALVLGHPCAAAAIAAAKIYAAQSTLFLATATRHPALTSPRAGPVIFRLSGRDDRQGEDAGRYLAQAFLGKTVAIVHDRTQFARTIAEHAAAVLTKFGMTPITATLIAGEKDFPLVTAKIKSAAAVFYAGFPLEAGLLVQHLKAAGSSATVLLSDSNATREFTGTFGAGATGVQVMRARTGLTNDDADADRSSNVGLPLRAAHHRLAATALERFAAAATAVKSMDAKKIAEWLASSGIATPLGPIAFDASGDAQRASFDVDALHDVADGRAVWKRAHVSPPYR